MTIPVSADGGPRTIDKCWGTRTDPAGRRTGRCYRPPAPGDRLGLCDECGPRLRDQQKGAA